MPTRGRGISVTVSVGPDGTAQPGGAAAAGDDQTGAAVRATVPRPAEPVAQARVPEDPAARVRPIRSVRRLAKLSTVRLSTVRLSTARLGIARLGTAWLSTAWLGIARLGTAWLSTARLGTARLEIAWLGTVRSAGALFRATGRISFGVPTRRLVRVRRAVRRSIAAGRPALLRIQPAALAAGLSWIVAGVTLFVCYLHVSRTTAVSSDGASNALQAWDLLHHNLLLRGWLLSDVSFYTTELPQYAAIEELRGLSPDVVHIASAMTYTLLVLLAAMAAKGRTSGREALVRCLLAAGIMLAPQLGSGVYVLLGSPDHVGSAVPVLAVFLLLDRAPARWYVPIAAGLLLTWALTADGIVLYTGVLPVVLVGLARAYQIRFRRRMRWRQAWFELALAAAAATASWLAALALAQIRTAGGFVLWPISNSLASTSDLPRYLTVTARGLLLLFGANFFGHSAGFVAALAALHLVGLGLAGWGTCAALRRFGHADLAVQLLAAGIAVTLTAYLFGTRADDLLSTRDITAVLPFGAALAGRLLAVRLARARLLPALAAVLLAYLISLGRVVTQPPVPPQDARLASWLAAHHLNYGLAGYWDANVTTLDTAGRVDLRSVLADGSQITGDYWEVRSDWYNPKLNNATFIVLVPSPPGFKRYPTIAEVRHAFGQPARIYYLGSYTILVWNSNLLASLGRGGPLPVQPPVITPPTIPIPAPPGR